MAEAGTPLFNDALAALADPEAQRQAARTAQDAFSRIFRLTLDGEEAEIRTGVAAIEARLRGWVAAAGDEDGRALRLALLVTGMDQWGVAYSRAFGLAAIPGLSELIGALRTALDARDEARFARQFAAIDAAEANAIDFKVELRRGIHLALWHALIACEERDEAERILAELGAMMTMLVGFMPEYGWRLVADALAHLQIRCLEKGLAAEGLAQEMTQGLFAHLDRSLPKATRDRIMAHAAQAVLAWQQARRSVH